MVLDKKFEMKTNEIPTYAVAHNSIFVLQIHPLTGGSNI